MEPSQILRMIEMGTPVAVAIFSKVSSGCLVSARTTSSYRRTLIQLCVTTVYSSFIFACFAYNVTLGKLPLPAQRTNFRQRDQCRVAGVLLRMATESRSNRRHDRSFSAEPYAGSDGPA